MTAEVSFFTFLQDAKRSSVSLAALLLNVPTNFLNNLFRFFPDFFRGNQHLDPMKNLLKQKSFSQIEKSKNAKIKKAIT